MYKYLILVLFITSNLNINAQQISAVYAVQILHPAGVNLNYEGRFFASGSKSAQYLVPLYLNDYPDGYIQVTKEKGISVSKDTLQEYMVVDLDSGILRVAYALGPNEYHTFEQGYLHWEIFPEVRSINGIMCQRAVWRRNPDKNPLGEIWFTSEIPVSLGIIGLNGVPGLIVELKWGDTYRASLLSYDVLTPVPKNVFWPDIFNRPFKFGGHSKRIKTGTD